MDKLRRMRSEISLTKQHDLERNGVAVPQVAFQKDIRFVIVFAQIFGLMPVLHTSKKNVNQINFRWWSYKTVYSFLNLAGSLVTGIFCIVKLAITGLRIDRTGTLSFYILNSFASWQFIQISRKWCVLIKQWCLVEMSMRGYSKILHLRKTFLILTTIIMGLALVEHLLFVANAFVMSKHCENFPEHPAEIYFGNAFPHIFTLIRYSYWKAVLFEVVNILSTVTWNFTDLFVILNSCSLTARFQQIVSRIEHNPTIKEKTWRDIREDYNRVSRLCLVVDEHLSGLVLISFTSNIYFICVQLYNSLKERIGIVDSVYFFFSFGFLLVRTTAVTLFAAQINDQSKKPLEMLYSVSPDNYSAEVSRFINQVNSSQLGLSGYRLFTVTRTFLLKMAGTIVTFELMFLQFGPLLKNNEVSLNKTYICIK